MAEPNPKVDVFFRKATQWPEEMRRLREIMLEFPVEERLRWRQPCYAYAGGNVGLISSLKAHAMISFFRGALLDDPAGLLVRPGAHSQAARYLPFTSVEAIERNRDTIRGYIHNALDVHDNGLKVDFTEKHDLDYPPELAEALAEDPDLAAAFEALTPGRRRGWVLLFAEPKKPETRAARVEKARPQILAGKGRHD